MRLVTIFILATIAQGCATEQIRFRKARLLDPMMDPAKTTGFHQSMNAEPTLKIEKGSSDIGGNVGASCPTCGG